MVSFERWGLDKLIERAKKQKCEVVWPHLRDWMDVLVVVWWGCGNIRECRSIVFDIDCKKRWYLK